MTEEKYARILRVLMKANKLASPSMARDLFTNANLPKFFPKGGPRVLTPAS